MDSKKWFIDAGAFIAEAERRRDKFEVGSRVRDNYNSIIGYIKYNSTPADVVEVVHGKWIEGDLIHRYGCSCCGVRQDKTSPYCPNCGALMDGGK